MSNRLLVLISIAALGSGCTPDCEQTCRHVLECDIDSPQVAIDQCRASCETEQHLYEAWGDEDKQQAFRDERSCLVGATCDEIADGVCYDEDMYTF